MMQVRIVVQISPIPRPYSVLCNIAWGMRLVQIGHEPESKIQHNPGGFNVRYNTDGLCKLKSQAHVRVLQSCLHNIIQYLVC